MSHRGLIWLAVGVLGACGSDATDAGSGTGTLLVNASVEYEGGGARMQVNVRRAGAPVTDATVRMASDLGEVLLTHDGEGVYRGIQAGWRGSYALQVVAGANGADHLDGSIETPSVPVLTRPDPAIAFDPHLAPAGAVEVRWSGDRAMLIRVKTKEYDPGFIADEGRLLISNTYFVENRQELELDRRNGIDLAGGAPGSRLRAEAGAKVELSIINPY